MRLKWFALGVTATVIALTAAAYVYLEKGFADTRADITPGPLDSWLGTAMDASTDRHAPKLTNPVLDTEENLLAAARLYTSNCLLCHGGADGVRSDLGDAVLPPAPQFFGSDPPDMMEDQNFYIIKHGIRMTAMPAWGKLLSEQQVWQTVLLLKHIHDKSVPQAVEQELKKKPQPPTSVCRAVLHMDARRFENTSAS
jgi:mono/diheme cytochrome c family protein